MHQMHTPKHPTVRAEFRLLSAMLPGGPGYWWEYPAGRAKSDGFFETQEECEKAALRYLRSLPA